MLHQDNKGRRVTAGIERGRQIEIEVDGKPIVAYEGETIAAAILASGRRSLRRTAKFGAPRGVFCGIGLCFGCLMTVDDVLNVRVCVTRAEHGMVVRTQNESDW